MLKNVTYHPATSRHRLSLDGSTNVCISVSPGQTAANKCETAFSLHVVESASDDYSF